MVGNSRVVKLERQTLLLININLKYNFTMLKSLSIFILCMLMASACTTRSPGIGSPVEWSDLENWTADNQSDAWEGFIKSCQKLKQANWQEVCLLAQNAGHLGDAEVREFFESHFEVRPVYAEGGDAEGLITGYYEPLLQGSWDRSDEYRYPLYGVPKDLLIVDLGGVYPQLKNLRLRGMLDGNRVVPYHDRARLDDDPDLLQGTEILWVDSPVDVFFLHVQGSGQIRLTDDSTLSVGYAEQNGHPYQSIGRVLIEMGELEKEAVTLFTIKDWLKSNPTRLNEVLSRNPSYVFFELRDAEADGPVGSLNVALTPGAALPSIAT